MLCLQYITISLPNYLYTYYIYWESDSNSSLDVLGVCQFVFKKVKLSLTTLKSGNMKSVWLWSWQILTKGTITLDSSNFSQYKPLISNPRPSYLAFRVIHPQVSLNIISKKDHILWNEWSLWLDHLYGSPTSVGSLTYWLWLSTSIDHSLVV